ncbi:hypothetical protein TNCV_536341 [Trichonephila clavipes]|nr:hypothetical protein TNCV_536341 [Trichonephila clavipes]
MQMIQVLCQYARRGGATIRKRVLYKPAQIRRFISTGPVARLASRLTSMRMDPSSNNGKYFAPCKLLGMPQESHQHKTQQEKTTKNVWQERAAARKENKKQPTPSFAEAVKGTKNNSLDAKEVMAQMMSQWGQMLSLLQTKL